MNGASVLVLLATWCWIAAIAEPSAVDRLAPTAAAGARRREVLHIVRRAAGRFRRIDVDADLAAATATLAAQVRAGGSVEEGFAAAGRAIEGRVGVAFRGLAERLAFGEPFGEALDRWSQEVGTSDAALLATTLRMHRRAGGSLAPVLEELARATRERIEVEADLRALTAQGRMSAWIVGSLPVGFLAFLTLLTGTSILATFATPLGAAVLVVGLGLETAAVAWMRRILTVRA